jgi:diaminohydroxyphosphoribosylaminopyrimidine deaminase/5-amino-6-(5-phosphoribosylamino)uracil reductase
MPSQTLREKQPRDIIYVTLEPVIIMANSPCTKAILESGIKNVVVGMRDPNPM